MNEHSQASNISEFLFYNQLNKAYYRIIEVQRDFALLQLLGHHKNGLLSQMFSAVLFRHNILLYTLIDKTKHAEMFALKSILTEICNNESIFVKMDEIKTRISKPETCQHCLKRLYKDKILGELTSFSSLVDNIEKIRHQLAHASVSPDELYMNTSEYEKFLIWYKKIFREISSSFVLKDVDRKKALSFNLPSTNEELWGQPYSSQVIETIRKGIQKFNTA